MGSLVWFDGNVGYPLPGRIVSVMGTNVNVQLEDSRQCCTVPADSITPRTDTGGMDNMIKLDDLHEGSILLNIKTRYQREKIYTYIGSILIAVNPYMQHGIYDEKVVHKYEGKPMGSLPPHLFSIGNAAYQSMLRDSTNQVIVISGESGAGKTESTKLLVEFLATVSQDKSSLITKQILEATPLLESFGNAKTVKNDNSSRFGKYLEIYYDKHGSITSGRASDYLLERSRVVGQAPGERNYHIFYEMLSGLSDDQKQKYQLKNADEYVYLNQGRSSATPKRNDLQYFQRVLSAMDVLGISKIEKDGIFSVLTAVLNLGNIRFTKLTRDSAAIATDHEVKLVAQFLGLHTQDLVTALTYKRTEARGEHISSPLNVAQASDVRDSLAKEFYSRLFTWLVNRVNGTVFQGKEDTSIAILDIFGFEVLQRNSFEQLCINFANETLQFFFNRFIFKLEQDEYVNENISWEQIPFKNNQPCLDLLARAPHGIIQILSDQSSLPQATDRSFLEKCHFHHQKNKFYVIPRTQSQEFAVVHYAGTVLYQVDGFLDKNRNGLRDDLVGLLTSSRSMFVQELLPDLQEDPVTGLLNVKVPLGPRNSLKVPKTAAQKSTVSAKFNESLIRLVVAMLKCNPFFIRCIKPNHDKTPMAFDSQLVLEQLRYCGVLETVRIRKAGFPIRYTFENFVQRYKCLSTKLVLDGQIPQENCLKILKIVDGIDHQSYQFGRTKVFLRETLSWRIEEMRLAMLSRLAVVIQARVRGYFVSQNYLKMRKATIIIQSNTRRVLQRKKYLKARKGFILLQAVFRMKRQRRTFVKQRDEAQQQVQTEQTAAAKATRERAAEEKIAAEQAAKTAAENKEREKNAGTDVTHLEIPADLALVFANLQGWKLSDGAIQTCTDDIIKHSYRSSTIPKDIDEYLFSKFTQDHFKEEHNWKMTKTPINSSFTRLKYSDNVEAVALFKLVMRFMGDDSLTESSEYAVGNYIVQKGISNPDLCEEIYCQLCNQTWGNSSESCAERGWLLMALCLGCFVPSARLHNHLLKYVSDHAYDGYKSYCQHKLLCWDCNVPRAHPPCLLEWKAAQKRANMAVRCRCADGESRVAEVDSCTTGEQLAGLVLKDRGLQNPQGWSIDLEDNQCHYSLNGKDYVLDLISELEYPPAFPVCLSPSLLTLKEGHMFSHSKLNNLSNLHKAHTESGKPHVSEIAHKFSAADDVTAGSVPHGPREDALSSVTSARLASASHVHEDRLVSNTAARSRVDGIPPPPQAMVPPPPAPPPPDIPAPPPPPPVAPPPERRVIRKLTKKEKKRDPKTPELSMAEVVAKAKKMRESRQALSTSSSSASGTQESVEDPFEAAIKSQRLKSTKNPPPVQPKPQQEDTELKKAMRAKAKRMSQAWLDSQQGGTEAGGKPNSQAWKAEQPGQEQSQSEMSDFVDRLFDPVLTDGVDDLTDEQALNGAMKGGGGMKQPGSAPVAQDTTSAASTQNTPTVANGPSLAQGNGYLGMPKIVPISGMPAAGYYSVPYVSTPAMSATVSGMNGHASAAPVVNGPTMAPTEVNGAAGVSAPMMGYPGMSVPMAGVPGMMAFPGMNGPQQQVDPGFLAAQQQLLIERLLQQQAMMQHQQSAQSQKQQEQLMMLAQQQSQHLQTLQILLSNQGTGHPVPSPDQTAVPGEKVTTPVEQSPVPAGQDRVSLTSNGVTVVNLSDNVNGVSSSPTTHTTAKTTRASTMVASPPSPPPEFSDVTKNRSFTVPTSTQSPVSPAFSVTAVTQQDKSFPPPPPPLASVTDSSENSSQVKNVALAIAALEAKKPEPGEAAGPSSPRVGESSAFSESSASKLELSSSAVKDEKPHVRSVTSAHLNLPAAEQKRTMLHPSRKNEPFLMYCNQQWKLSLRKEVFMANEKIDNKVIQHLIFMQILRDAYATYYSCCRMSKDDRRRMRILLEKYGITPLRPSTSSPVEDIVIEAARQLPLYFSRFFFVRGQNELPDVQYLAVSENGLKLLKREKITDELEIVQSYPYTEVMKVKAAKNKLTITTKEAKVTLMTNRAMEVKQMVDPCLRQLEKEAKYVRALYDYVTQDPVLLNFKKGDVIQMVHNPEVEDGWLYGIFDKRSGYFPAEYVTHIKEEQGSPRPNNLQKAASVENIFNPDVNTRSRSGSVRSTRSDKSEYNNDKYSMMEFAMNNFRHGQYIVGTIRGTIRGKNSYKGTVSKKGSAKKQDDWTWKGLAQLVKFSEKPIQASLLPLETTQANKLATDCFLNIMRFMGDYNMAKGQKQTDIVYWLLKVCRENADLRDEVYCQLVKQVTSNKGQQESCGRGWRLLLILTAYMQCSEVLKPYMVKFLQTTAGDPKREFHGAAAICEQSFMKTFKYGGRKTPPTQMELDQLVLKGRQTKRQVFVLPGGVTRMLKVQTCSTGYDVIKNMCSDMGLNHEDDYQEYGLFTVLQQEHLMVPVQTSDYMMDVIGHVERQQLDYSLCFRRVLWYQPIRFSNELYVSVIYHQILPDYFLGHILGKNWGQSLSDAQFQNEIAELASLLHRARSETVLIPQPSQVEGLLPRNMQAQLRPTQWLMLVQDHFRSYHALTPHQARKKFLEIVSKWPHFGSSFFEIKHCSHPAVASECILAVNKHGVHLLHPMTKNAVVSIPFTSIVSTRMLVPDKKRQFLDLKIGNDMVQKVTRMETQQGKDIANLIFKYAGAFSEDQTRKQGGAGLAGVLRSQPEPVRK